MSERNSFVPWGKKQLDIVISDEDLTIAGCGTQAGKSIAGTLWMKRMCHTFTDSKDNFIVAAPSYKILSQSIIPYFLHYMRTYGDYSKVDSIFAIKNGGTIYFRTETDPDSIVGIPNVRAGWLDEAGKLRLYFWENYQARAASVGAKTLLTTSPYSLNWLYKQYIKPLQDGKTIPGVKLIQAASWENPYHTLADPIKREQMRMKMDPRRFDMIFGGKWERMAGLVYDCWDDDKNIIAPFSLPSDTVYYAGVDWGYTDPFALKIRAVTSDGRQYGVSEFYKTGMTVNDMIEVAAQKKKIFGIRTFFCDPSQPGHIEEFNRHGLSAIGADNDIRRGIDLHYQLIKSLKYKEFEGACPNSSDERESYHYPEPDDLGPDDKQKELLPVDQNNHLMDVDRYLSISLYRSGIRVAPTAPGEVKSQENQEQRIARLKRKNRNNQSENWT